MAALRKPAIKAEMGNWGYYVSTMTYKQLSDFVKMPDEVTHDAGLSNQIQRSLTDSYKDIIKYLYKDDDRFFNALILAVYGGKPSWYAGVFEKDDERFNNIGVLVFNGDEQIFPVDGQHRLKAIKEIVLAGKDNEDEEVPVIFVAHKNTDVERTRRLFISLNTSKPVSLSEMIALDEDDIVYIATRYIIEKTDLFTDKLSFSKTEAMSPTDNQNFTNIISFSKCIASLLSSFMGQDEDIKEYRRFRREDDEIKSFEAYVEEFWKYFINNLPDVKSFFDGEYNNDLRGSEGGNMLFRPRGLCPFVDAISTICSNEENTTYKDVINYFSNLEFDLTSQLWNNILWDGKIAAPGEALMRDLFIYIYDPSLLTEKRKNNIISRYCEKKQIGKEEAINNLQYLRGCKSNEE